MSRAVIDQYRRFGLLPVGDTTRGGGWWYKTDLDTQLLLVRPLGRVRLRRCTAALSARQPLCRAGRDPRGGR